MQKPRSDSPDDPRDELLHEWLRAKPVSSKLDASEAGQRVLQHQFAICISKVPGTRVGRDPEALHEMRVSIRRMRSALVLYRPYLEPDVLELADGLKWVGGVLGPVRDLDVQLEQLGEWRTSLDSGDAPALNAGEERGRSRWFLERKVMLEQLESGRYHSFVDDGVEILSRPTIDSPSIVSAAPKIIDRAYRRVRKLGDAIEATSRAERYHRVRVKMKSLRYAIEFHRAIYRKPAEQMIRTLKRLQDLLGDHQDADVAREPIRQLLADATDEALPAASAFVLGILDERYRRRAEELRSRFPERYEPLTGKPWRQFAKRIESGNS